MNTGWSWTLKLIVEKIEWTNVESMYHKEYEKQPLKTLTSTTRFGCVPYGEKKRFQDYRCSFVNNYRMMGIF
jgi:hypothetical protein